MHYFKTSIFFGILTLLAYNGAEEASPSKIDPQLKSLLESGGKANVLVSFHRGDTSGIEAAISQRSGDRGLRIQAIKKALEENTDASQAGVTQLLSARTGENFEYFKKYWVGNKLFIKGASAELVNSMAEDPAVRRIGKEPSGEIPPPLNSDKVNEEIKALKQKRSAGASTRLDPAVYGVKNIELIKVKEAWEEMGGNQGEGVLIGHIDSGVLYTHEALRDSFVGVEYGWLDAINNKTEPYYLDTHGTYTLGILVGSHGIGVAPGAKWMSCLACQGGCPGEALLDCLQFMTCPTLPDRTNQDCSRAPHVVSNSWASERGVDDYDEVLLDMRRMGIIPVFVIGNVGRPMCNKTRAPGDKPFVIGVGGVVSVEDWHSVDSAIGPAPDGTIKPDIAAPMSGLSADTGSDLYWVTGSGTSFATPHVAGVIALLKARDLELTYDEAYELITQNTDRDLSLNPGYKDAYCNESRIDVFPNNFVGYGRINAFKAVKAQSLKLAAK